MELITIAIPTFNGEKFLQEALNSVIAQTYKNIEVVASDDNSSDDTKKILKEFQKNVNFPVKIYSHTPSGIGANWNNCLRKATGKYIKFLFQDDILYPDCIQKLFEVIDSNEKIALAACKRNFIIEGSYSEEIENWIKRYGNLQRSIDFSDNNVYILDKLFLRTDTFLKSPPNKIGEPTAVLFRLDIINEIGCFREDLDQILDYEFYYRILKFKKIALLNEELVSFRIHPKQATIVNRNRKIKDYELYDKILYKDFFWYLNLTEKKRLLGKYNKIGKFYLSLRNGKKKS